MKRFLMAALAAATVSMPALAQVPQFVPVQGYLTDAEDVPLAGPVTVTFGLYAEPAGGEAAWTETQELLVEDGFFTAWLGQNAPLDLAVLSDGGARFLGVAVADDPEMSPRIPLGTVPFAAVAARAAEADDVPGLASVAWSGTWEDLAGRPELSAVATSGRFDDLVDVPAGFGDGDDVLTETQVDDFVANNGYAADADLSALQSSLAAVAKSGLYADLTGTPQLAPIATSGSYADLTGTPQLAPIATSGSYADLTGAPQLATVATSGSYADLAGTPTLAPVASSGAFSDLTGLPAGLADGDDVLTEAEVDAFVGDNGYAAAADLSTLQSSLASVATSGLYADLAGTPQLAPVATSGLYADLAGTPSLAPIATTGAWSDLGKVPASVQQLGALACNPGESLEADASGALTCGVDDTLDPAGLIQNQTAAVQSGGFRIGGTAEMGQAQVTGDLAVAGAATVGGAVTAASFSLAAPAVRSHVVSPFECRERPGGSGLIGYDGTYVSAYVSGGVAPWRAVLDCPVHLPARAVMSAFTCHFSDADAEGWMRATLRSKEFGSFAQATNKAQVVTGVVQSGGSALLTSAVGAPVVMNGYDYHVLVEFFPGTTGPNLSFYGCKIDYQTTAP